LFISFSIFSPTAKKKASLVLGLVYFSNGNISNIDVNEIWEWVIEKWVIVQNGWDIAEERLERLTVNAKDATVLQGSIPSSSDTVKFRGAADEAVLNIVHNKKTTKI
jgi:hypothetical protein